MREIRFRAWDNILNEYFSWEDSVKFNNYHDLIEDNYDGAVILEQYTGINDVNGVEIYENDLVKVISQYWGQLGNVYKVEFYEGAFIARNPLYDMHDSIKVIGNIHKQPELLEEK